MTIFAHSNQEDPTQASWELLAEHLGEVGVLASEFAEAFARGDAGRAAGLLHDIGKTAHEYQEYIRRPREEGGAKGPDHSTAGAREAHRLYGPMGHLLAFAIAGHHSGLMNGRGNTSTGRSLHTRLDPSTCDIPSYEGWQNHVGNLPEKRDVMGVQPSRNAAYPGFEYFFLARMLFSCLVDADFIATERFYADVEQRERPKRGGTIDARHLDAVRTLLNDMRRSDTEINRLRSEILDHAVAKAALEPGLFTFTVPTGGGKTLASLNFALDHALRWGKQRIIYVIPFTSIIEQTADVFRGALQDDGAILEHHSNFDWDKDAPRGDDKEGEGRNGLAKLRRDAENWDAPIIVTTAVQFFESLFARRTSRTRKLHNIANSVIVLDEVQTMPVHLLRPCMATLDELARNYGASVVLCTATQPALRLKDGALPVPKSGPAEGFSVDDDRELAPRPAELYKALKRVEVEWHQGETDDVTIASRFAELPQMLCIVNSRRHARELFERIIGFDGTRHLSTLMCAKHRRQVLAELREDLKAGKPVRLVATSLIEAGVDIDIPEVWRAATGLDSIAQAAGRCNREGKLNGHGRVVVFEAAGRKNPPAIEAFWAAGRTALRQAERRGADPLGLEAVHAYFTELYFAKRFEALDAATLDALPYPIIPAIRDAAREMTFPFASISDAFRMIDDEMVPVLIPFDQQAIELLDALEKPGLLPSGSLRKLQQYSVSVPRRALDALSRNGAVQPINPDAYGDRFLRLESTSLYHQSHGLDFDDPTFRSANDNVFS